MGCHFLLEGILVTQGRNRSLLSLLHWQAGSSSLCHPGSPHSEMAAGCILATALSEEAEQGSDLCKAAEQKPACAPRTPGSHPPAQPSHPGTPGPLAPLGQGRAARTLRGAYEDAVASQAALNCDVGLAGQRGLSNRQQSTGVDVIVSKCSHGARGENSLAVMRPWL